MGVGFQIDFALFVNFALLLKDLNLVTGISILNIWKKKQLRVHLIGIENILMYMVNTVKLV